MAPPSLPPVREHRVLVMIAELGHGLQGVRAEIRSPAWAGWRSSGMRSGRVVRIGRVDKLAEDVVS